MPDELLCKYDEDGNGLDDEMEERLACCFGPEFRFDADENALHSDEPFLMFNAQVVGPSVVRLKYVAFWRHDGGEAECGNSDEHDPDAQGFSIDVARDPGLFDLWTIKNWSVSGHVC